VPITSVQTGAVKLVAFCSPLKLAPVPFQFAVTLLPEHAMLIFKSGLDAGMVYMPKSTVEVQMQDQLVSDGPGLGLNAGGEAKSRG